MTIARRFGYTQGVAAQMWVESAVKSRDANSDTLMQMQLSLFDECSVDDTSGRCKALSEAVDAMKAAVEAKSSAAPAEKKSKKGFKLPGGPSELQAAATKVREAATRFGPSQKAAANDWIKMVTLGTEAGAVTSGFRESLLAQKITLFGECLLSEDGSPSDCQQLEQALAELQEAIELTKPVESWYDAGVRLQ